LYDDVLRGKERRDCLRRWRNEDGRLQYLPLRRWSLGLHVDVLRGEERGEVGSVYRCGWDASVLSGQTIPRLHFGRDEEGGLQHLRLRRVGRRKLLVVHHDALPREKSHFGGRRQHLHQRRGNHAMLSVQEAGTRMYGRRHQKGGLQHLRLQRRRLGLHSYALFGPARRSEGRSGQHLHQCRRNHAMLPVQERGTRMYGWRHQKSRLQRLRLQRRRLGLHVQDVFGHLG